MKHITFEEYLQKVHFEENPTLLDDDIPDAFDNWIGSLEGNDLIEYAESYGLYLINKFKK